MQHYGIILLGAVAGRAEASDKAEMVTQLVFGEPYTILEEAEKWIKVRSQVDEYSCWIDRKQHNELSENELENLNLNTAKRCGSVFADMLRHSDGARIPVSFGAILPNYQEGKCRIKGVQYSFEGRIARKDSTSLERHARRILHIPYLWGGKSASGMDCSGFIQLLYACSDIALPRDAAQQAKLGEEVSVEEAKYGDLAFFSNENGKITHVGALLRPDLIVHASGSVRMDSFDQTGIKDSNGEYTHKLAVVKRMK